MFSTCTQEVYIASAMCVNIHVIVVVLLLLDSFGVNSGI